MLAVRDAPIPTTTSIYTWGYQDPNIPRVYDVIPPQYHVDVKCYRVRLHWSSERGIGIPILVSVSVRPC